MSGQKGKEQRRRPSTRYSEEYRVNAAKMVIQKGYSHARGAKELCCSEESVRNWVKRYFKEIASSSPKGLSAEERAYYWERRCRRAELEAEFLKKAAAYFEKESK